MNSLEWLSLRSWDFEPQYFWTELWCDQRCIWGELTWQKWKGDGLKINCKRAQGPGGYCCDLVRARLACRPAGQGTIKNISRDIEGHLYQNPILKPSFRLFLLPGVPPSSPGSFFLFSRFSSNTISPKKPFLALPYGLPERPSLMCLYNAWYLPI